MSSAKIETPRFAVVGRVNKGKSSILATLVEEADNARIRISEIPGETTRCNSIPLVLDGETLIEFIDTPGFSRARQALAWLKENHSEESGEARIETVRRFIEAHRDGDDFTDECLLLEPVLEGAGIVYIVDASKPFRPDFTAEMEILRWTGRPRMAVMNSISGDSDFSEEWRERLSEFFNLTRDFNAHRAKFQERIRLLRHLLEIEDHSRSKIEKTIDLLEAEWVQRREKAAEVIVALLEKALALQVCRKIQGGDSETGPEMDALEADLKDDYLNSIRKLETKQHRRLVKLYRHHKSEAVDLELDEVLDGADLFARETWQAFGLSRTQFVKWSAASGAVAGLAVDVGTGGGTVGIGALIGGAIGGGAALFGGRWLAESSIKVKSVKFPMGKVQRCVGPWKDLNFPWVLLGRILFHYEQIISRAHGRRDAFVIDFSKLSRGSENRGYAARFSKSRCQKLRRWFSEVSGDRHQNGEDAEIFEILREVLEEIEEGDLRMSPSES